MSIVGLFFSVELKSSSSANCAVRLDDKAEFFAATSHVAFFVPDDDFDFVRARIESVFRNLDRNCRFGDIAVGDYAGGYVRRKFAPVDADFDAPDSAAAIFQFNRESGRVRFDNLRNDFGIKLDISERHVAPASFHVATSNFLMFSLESTIVSVRPASSK